MADEVEFPYAPTFTRLRVGLQGGRWLSWGQLIATRLGGITGCKLADRIRFVARDGKHSDPCLEIQLYIPADGRCPDPVLARPTRPRRPSPAGGKPEISISGGAWEAIRIHKQQA